MEDYSLLIDLHKRAKRQGPGGDSETQKALNLALLDPSTPLKIADIGCGTGASTLFLAHSLNAQITAVDFLHDFIKILMANAEKKQLGQKIEPLVCSMENLPFKDNEYDVVWSEGAIYNIGFETGVNQWKQFLKSNGILAVSEITWTTQKRPSEIQEYWETEYPEIGTPSAKIQVLENAGYSLMGYFPLPEYCWLENYYRPMQQSFDAFLERNSNNTSAQEVVASEQQEIALYEQYKAYYSYGFYIARKL